MLNPAVPLSLIQSLLLAGADPNVLDDYAKSPLYEAVYYQQSGAEAIVALLLSFAADVESRSFIQSDELDPLLSRAHWH